MDMEYRSYKRRFILQRWNCIYLTKVIDTRTGIRADIVKRKMFIRDAFIMSIQNIVPCSYVTIAEWISWINGVGGK